MRRLQQMQVNSGTRTIINNAYNYDLVGNVLGIKNTAPVVNNTLGGSAEQNYQYDELYRLKTATGSYTGEFTQANYQLNMSYNNLHNITKKELIHTVNGQQKGYTLHYDYGNTEHPNAPNAITEVGKPEPRKYSYDGNGNPTNYSEFNSFRKMTWDEENRLMGINDNGKLHIYSYDANGERVIKSNGDSQNVTINGTNAATLNHFENYTAYVSPYFVVNKGKFTKHYFEGAGRVTSKIGEGTFKQPAKITAGGYNYGQLSALQQQAIDAYIASLGIPPGPITQQGIYASPQLTGQPYPSAPTQNANENQEPPQGWPRQPVFNAPNDVPGPPVQFGPPITPADVKAGEGFVGNGLPEKDVFYYHPDHLGSSSYISTLNGQISQHVEYIAFGEVLFEEHSSSFKSPYLFNGKELDRETNLTNFGARYLDMKTSLWLNVDPLAEETPEWSPYAYAMNNPMNMIDPDGRSAESVLDQEDPPGKKKQSTASTLKPIEVREPMGGYVGQGLDELVTAGIQWLGEQISGSDVSKETSENFQFATSLAIVIVSKGKNVKADGEVVEQLTKAEARAAKLSKVDRSGKDFTKAGKRAVIDVNKAKNGGKTVCEGCGTSTTKATQSKKGVTPSKRETQVDHVNRKRNGGSGTPNNGQVLCRGCNLDKH
ncbi:RHS repeat-associated core domain-containing protein [Flavobacterium psychrophilum]|uniref:HNH endonuclease n=1 Tax=Flavobacterium psychrophilum TaxID=96345 RepID=A0A7U2NGE2_FLAPS|nr:RHS repeat-associated core domain-containing protein [Flavobacterium psychrophilum]QRE04062.1 HNH endonuclease [Flavobacterium psychrophilum]